MDQATKPKSVTVVVDAFSTNDFEDGPVYAAFVVNEEFLRRIHAVRSVVERMNLSHAGLFISPEKWGPGDIENNLRLQSCELVISPTGYSYFEAKPKFGAFIQSRGRDLSNLEEAFAEANDGDIVCLAETEDVKTMYLEDTAEEQAQPA